ncbi:MAG: hypothetical protein JO290_06145 [Sphingomonadaceae bacterium]|nr:hypothetical protein [Sphingomonadaceae bacterium]
MTFTERLFGGIKDLIVMRDDLKRLQGGVDRLIAKEADHESRLVRIETIIEMSTRPSQRRLPRE